MRRQVLKGIFLACLAALAGSGCGASVSQQELDQARDAVQSGLEAWKKGEPPSRLKALTPPVEFSDDSWARGEKLLDFRLNNAEGKPGTPLRCTVSLTLQDRRGKTLEKEVVYEVKLGNPRVVARDPYF
jgi:hypothetical protein